MKTNTFFILFLLFSLVLKGQDIEVKSMKTISESSANVKPLIMIDANKGTPKLIRIKCDKIENILPVWSNGSFSILKKVDGTFSIKIEATQKEYGHFLTQKEAEDFIKEDTTTE